MCTDDGNCADSDIIEGIGWAVASGANIISMSWGDSQNSQAIADALTTAWNRGLLLVAGAGNDGNTNVFYPAALPNVISVAASDEDDNHAYFSNYGWPTVAAPGNAIMSTWPMAGCIGAQTSPGDEGCYNWLDGTSMSTPVVSGAALVWAVCTPARTPTFGASSSRARTRLARSARTSCLGPNAGA